MSQNLSHQPGADELRVAHILRQQGVGPDATAHPDEPTSRTPARPAGSRLPDWRLPKPGISPNGIVEPEPPQRPRDWLDDILEANATPAPESPARGPVELTAPVAKEHAGKTPKKLRRQRPAYRTHQPDHSPRQSLLDAYASIPSRVRWLIYHTTAATAGWRLGWVDWGTDTAAWYAAGHWTSPSGFVLYGLGLGLCALYRRSRHWAWPVAWAAAVPVSSIALGVLLYAPTQ